MQEYIIRTTEEEAAMEIYQEDDLVYISRKQNPFQFHPELHKDGAWEIPCNLGLIEKIEFDPISGLPFTMHIRLLQNGSSIIFGCYIEDVIANRSKRLRCQVESKSAEIIQSEYRRRYMARHNASQIIQDAYIRHYYNPKNPNMMRRLEHDFISLSKQTEQLSCKL